MTLNVTLTQNMKNSITTDFKAIVILVLPPALSNKMYMIGAQTNTLTLSPFEVETGTQETYSL